jgi:hypothetical protein
MFDTLSAYCVGVRLSIDPCGLCVELSPETSFNLVKRGINGKERIYTGTVLYKKVR